MTIETGLAWSSFAVDDAGGTARELDGHITTCSFNTTVGIQDTTPISASARHTNPLLADLQDNFSLLFDDEADQSFDVVKTVGSNSGPRTITRAHSGQTLASESNLSSVSWARQQSGELLAAVSAVLANGVVPTWS